MKKMTIFYTILAVAWTCISIANGFLMFQGTQVDAINAFCPSALCAILYAVKLAENK